MKNNRWQLSAWGVHIFTALGVVCAMFASIAILEDQKMMCMLWLTVTLVIDGVDGTLARKIGVKHRLPYFDGSILDLIIDYLTYVFVPALFIYKYIALPANFEHFTLAVILVSSLYCFCNVNMKSNDNYFVGFPATWNVVALYFYILQTPSWLNLSATLLLAILTVSKIKFLHPFRVKRLMALNLVVTLVWLITSIILARSTPQHEIISWLLWWFSGIYFLGVGLYSTFFDAPSQH